MMATVAPEAGLTNDRRDRARASHVPSRQVLIPRIEDRVVAEATLGTSLSWTMRRVDLLVSGAGLPHRADDWLRVGGLTPEITGECDPCRWMDERHPGLWPAPISEWRGGVPARVIVGGDISLGDEVRMDAL